MSDTLADVNPHLAGWLAESAACEPSDWERWAEQVERLIGHDLDGDQSTDGYSLDWAYEQWQAGASVRTVAAAVKAATR